MTVDYTALWDEIYTLLSTDSTLVTLIGTVENIGRGFAPNKYDMSDGKTVLLIGDVDADVMHYQVDDGVMFISAWSGVGETVISVLDRVAALFDGYDPTVTWVQQITRRGRTALAYDTTDQLHFGRDSYKLPHRRL